MYDSRVIIQEADEDNVYVAAFLLNEGEANEAHAQAFIPIDENGDALKGRKAEGDSLPTVFSVEDRALMIEMRDKLELIKETSAAGAAAGAATVAALGDTTTPIAVESGVRYVDVTLSLSTSPYAANELLADAQVVAGAVRAIDALGALASVQLIDEDKQGAAIDLYFSTGATSWGSENSAPTYSLAIARTILTRVEILTGDYKDFGTVAKIAEKANLNRPIKPAAGTTSIYVAAVIITDGKTFTANGIRLRLGFLS